jgi:peptidyl-tRNA hydrolase, PTH2 family
VKDEIAIYVIVRNDLGMSPGKIAAQVGHGIELSLERGSRYFPQWTPTDKPCAKIILQTNSGGLIEFMNQDIGKCVFVVDEGRTEIEPDTMTVAALVPMPRSVAKPLVEHLKLYR